MQNLSKSQHTDFTVKLAAAESSLQQEIQKSFSLLEELSEAQQVRSSLQYLRFMPSSDCLFLCQYTCVRMPVCVCVYVCMSTREYERRSQHLII